MLIVNLGNGDIAVKEIVNPENDEVSLEFSKLDDTGELGELIDNDIGQPICKIAFSCMEGIDNFIEIIKSLKDKVCRNNYFL